MVPVILLTRLAGAATAEPPPGTFAKLPIKEITVFKDGHAFVAHEGEMPTDDHGNVVMDYLPAPVIGTFWPYSAEKRARLRSVVASQKRVLVERTALNLRELLEANIGAEAIIAEAGRTVMPPRSSACRRAARKNRPPPVRRTPARDCPRRAT